MFLRDGQVVKQLARPEEDEVEEGLKAIIEVGADPEVALGAAGCFWTGMGESTVLSDSRQWIVLWCVDETPGV